ncbi:GNAT family N-acetyltransferase [Streptomyces sp. NPDC050617]|uniref:GNAT family N-acetyltransferase n=1 Tax=Streptomyces sp. NPDC050617 TaxID=3154628 RepID=UPI00341DE14B
MSTEHVVTYLEMTERAQLRPARPAEGVALEETPAGSEALVETQAAVGAPHQWSGGWRARRHDERMRHWLIRVDGEVAGVLSVRGAAGGEVEIDTFGLLPRYVGRGYGGHALTLAVRQAWDQPPLDAPAVRRVWLHTSTRDHPHALRNYERRGFQRYASEREAPRPD